MPSFTLERVELFNFFAFDHATVELSLPGLTLVEGVMLNCPGSSSNGAGKSTVPEAVAWCWYGRTLREKYKDFIKRGKEWCQVITTLRLDDRDELVIIRYRKHPQHGDKVMLRMNGEDITHGTNPETDAAIIQALGGMDFVAFTNSIAFGAREDVTSFFGATDSIRKQVLERILGLGVFSQAEAIARKRHAVAKAEAEQARSALAAAESLVAGATTALQSAQSSMEDVGTLERATNEQRLRVRAAQRLVADIDVDMAELTAELTDRGAVHDKLYAEWARTKILMDRDIAGLVERRAYAEASIRSAESSVRAIEIRKARFTALAATTCPTCQQDITAEHCATVAASFDEEASGHRYLITASQMDLDMCAKDLAALPILAPEPSRVLLDSVEEQIAEQRHARATAMASLSAASALLAERIERLADATSVIDNAANDVTAAEAQLQEARAAVQLADVHEARHAFWVHAFGNSGIKSFLIEAELAEINRRVSTYAQRLLGPGARMWLCATRELKSGKGTREEITVHVDIPGRAESYYGASKGQKRRLDLCIILGLRDLVATRSSHACKQLFVDEVFDGVDSAGTDFIVELLREMAAVGPVLLITHNEGLRRAADHLVTITHDGTDAALVLTHL